MSSTFEHTHESLQRLKRTWQAADEDARWGLEFWASGLALMSVAIIAAFGWLGLLFCFGLLLWAVGNQTLSRV